MSEKFQGGCFCGEIRYEATGPAKYPGHCQCTNCRKFSGSAHASLMMVEAGGFELTGKPVGFSYSADSGNSVLRNFCPVCGGWIFNTNSGMPGKVFLVASSLDDPGLFQPEMVVYTASALVWDRVDEALPAFQRMPGQ